MVGSRRLQVRAIGIPCIEMIFWRPVAVLAILIAASMASEPEFHQKNELREGSGMSGRIFSMSFRYGGWNAMLHCGRRVGSSFNDLTQQQHTCMCTTSMHCFAAAPLTRGWQ